ESGVIESLALVRDAADLHFTFAEIGGQVVRLEREHRDDLHRNAETVDRAAAGVVLDDREAQPTVRLDADSDGLRARRTRDERECEDRKCQCTHHMTSPVMSD